MVPRSNNNCAECTKASKCFQLLYSDELEFISKKKTQVTYLKGETIFKQGAFAPYVLYVVDGLVKVYLQTGVNKQVNIRLTRQGEFMAFSSVFDENIYQYSAVAIKESTICMIDKTALKQLITKNTDFAARIISRNFRNEFRYLEIIRNISYNQMRGKMASALLYLSGEEFQYENVFQCLTRQDIADFASVTMESAVKFLKEFEAEGLIQMQGKDILIPDHEKLALISRNG
ncbi:MAG: Crp/Fnr family transcriptional regulator [Bacteroidales bacterium]|nr:Crp/Fnr family transcriptional regulator [Bacteroidales bacterium]